MTAFETEAAVFLDRDGTLVREVGYLRRPEELEVLPGVAAALRQLRARGFKLVVITNQSAVGRGLLSESELASIHELLRVRLAAQGAHLDALYYCPHHPTEGQGIYKIQCNCRKPKTGLVDRAARELGLNPKVSYVIGDQSTDMELAREIGAVGVLLRPAAATAAAVGALAAAACSDLPSAAQWIAARQDRIGVR